MSVRLYWCVSALLAACGLAHGQAVAYEPLGTWTDPQAARLAQWNARALGASQPPVTGVARPTLAGLRPKSVELLEDAFLRKHPKLLQNRPEWARELVLRRYSKAEGPLRGHMAEAIFIDRNPAWQYVKKPNATQHDVYRWIEGRRPPFNGQIKYHDSGQSSLYARDMIADYLAHRFFIPDDHVEPTKAYLRAQAERAATAGNVIETRQHWRNYSRLRPIGATSTEIRSATTEAARFVAKEKYAVYTSLGAASALAFAPALFDLANGRTTANLATYQVARSLSLIGVGYGADQGVSRFMNGAMRGGVRGNVIVAGALTIAEISWLLHEQGWRRAFYQPEFYEEVVGGVSAIGLALAGGAAATSFAAGTGPWAPLLGTGAAVISGTIGYFGGAVMTHELLELVAPDRLRSREREKFGSVRSWIDRSIQDLQTIN